MALPRDFPEQLEKQLRFIETSCQEYDAGNRDEAIRIATHLRVVFHHSRYPSLLSHLGAKTVQLLSTATRIPNNNPSQYWPSLVSWTIAPAEAVFMCVPKFGSTPQAHRSIPFTAWWDGEPIFQHGHRKVKRNRLILDAANKDGGAHVDATLPENYRWLAVGTGWKLTLNPAGGPTEEVALRFPHLAALRQIAYEVLNSQDLLRLAGRT